MRPFLVRFMLMSWWAQSSWCRGSPTDSMLAYACVRWHGWAANDSNQTVYNTLNKSHRCRYFTRGGSRGVWPIVHEPRSGEPIFLWLFYEPRSGEPIFFLAILRAAKRRADFFGYFTSREAASRFFWLFYEPRSGEPIFFGYFEPP